MRNDGGGLFTTTGSIPTSVGATQLRLLDLNGDGDADLVTDNGAVTRVLTGDGAGNFTDTGQTIGAAIPGGISLGLLDGDVFPTSSSVVRVVGRRSSSTTARRPSPTGQSLGTASTRDTQLGDVDGDGDLDLVEGNNGGNRVWLNDGTGTFTDTLQSLGTGQHATDRARGSRR